MTPLFEFALLLCALYGLDCLIRLPPGAVLFEKSRGRWRWHANSSPSVRIRIVQMLPPFTPVLRIAPWPVQPTPERWWVADRGSAAGHSYDDVERLRRDGHTLLLERRKVVRDARPMLGQRLEVRLQGLAELSRPERRVAIASWLDESIDRDELARQLGTFEREARALKWMCQALLVTIAAAVAAILFAPLRPLQAMTLLVGVVALNAVTTWECAGAHRRLWPAESLDRRRLVLQTALSPLSGVRAYHALSLRILAGFDPFAVASVVLRPADLGACMRAVIGPALDAAPAAAADLETSRDWFRTRRVRAIARMLQAAGSSVDEILSPPARTESGRSYCPVCRAQYVVAEGLCTDCDGIALKSFASDT